MKTLSREEKSYLRILWKCSKEDGYKGHCDMIHKSGYENNSLHIKSLHESFHYLKIKQRGNLIHIYFTFTGMFISYNICKYGRY